MINTLALKGKRVSQGKTQAYMGALIGVNTGTYSCKERGTTELSPEEIVLIANDLNFTIYELNDIFFDGNLHCCNLLTSQPGSVS